MQFNSFEFLFFFPVVAILYYLFPNKYRWFFLLIAGYYFYMAIEPSLIILLLVSTSIDYYCGLKIYSAGSIKVKKRFLYLSILGNLGILFFFKYFGFFTETSLDVLHFFGIDFFDQATTQAYNFNQILLPAGISFYTFQTLSYSIDIYRGEIKPEQHFGRYALYVSFFPQLVAGPIERASRLLPQFYKKVTLNIEAIKQGIIMMAWGFFLKLVVSDRLGIYVDEVFYQPDKYKGLPLIIGAYFFVLQIYCDFSAYNNIALGAAKVLGFNLMQNFNRPLFYKNLGEMWRKWHISLMKWFRDYLYRPLVINYKMNRYLAVIIVFFFNGLWHGANWTFIVWGLLNGFYLLFENLSRNFRRKTLKKLNVRLPKKVDIVLWWFFTFNLITISLIFFRSSSITSALVYVKNMLLVNTFNVNVIHNSIEVFLCFFFIILAQVLDYFKGHSKVYELVMNKHILIKWALYLLFILVIVLFSVNRQNKFIYFQF